MCKLPYISTLHMAWLEYPSVCSFLESYWLWRNIYIQYLIKVFPTHKYIHSCGMPCFTVYAYSYSVFIQSIYLPMFSLPDWHWPVECFPRVPMGLPYLNMGKWLVNNYSGTQQRANRGHTYCAKHRFIFDRQHSESEILSGSTFCVRRL